MNNISRHKKDSSDRGIIDCLIGGLYLHWHYKLSENQNFNKEDVKPKPLTQEEKELRLKIKFFKLTIKSGFFCNTKIWELRDKPLSDKELNDFFKNNEGYL